MAMCASIPLWVSLKKHLLILLLIPFVSCRQRPYASAGQPREDSPMSKHKAHTVPTCALNPLLTCDELAALLKVHRRTVYRLGDSRKLPAPIKVGSQNRWRMEEIEEVIGTRS